MTSLRQRLLLVAGWAVAAVATGLVSAGAVAVAGGQVNDRPLRPLSAAEVVALPVTIDGPRVTSEPLASGGSVSPTATIAPDDDDDGLQAPGDDTARSAEKGPFPADDLDPIITLSGDFDESADPRDVELPQVGRRTPEPEVVTVVGGRVSVSTSDGEVVLNAATPRPGFVADADFDTAGGLVVTFWDGEHLSTVTVTADDDRLIVVPEEIEP
jgi:hypothetical protein